MTAMVLLPLALRPVIQTVTPFCPRCFSRSCRVTVPSCQVTLVAFCSAMKFLFLLEEWRTQIAFAEAAHDGDDHLAFVFRAGGDFGGGADIGAGADAAEYSLFLGQPPAPGEGVFVADLDHLIDDAG